jgi:DNA-binding beta-propeller fold protein YncE
MDENSLRDLLERATVPEPPIGQMAQNALRAGIRLRHRRRLQGTAACAAAVVMIFAAAVAVAGAVGRSAAAPVQSSATVYVLSGSTTRSTVTPISTATNTPGKPIVVGSGNQFASTPDMAITPNGKTLWVAPGSDSVTPISMATKTAGKPIKVVHQKDEAAQQVVITPDGKTVYVLDSTGAVTPISTATNTPGRPIELGQLYGAGSEMAITPDGQTLYVLMFGLQGLGPSYLVPIATATNKPGHRIRLDMAATAIMVTPDGKTAYVVGQPLTASRNPRADVGQEIEVTPIPTATNMPGKAISTGTTGTITSGTPVAMTQDGQTIYITGTSPIGVIPFSTAANRPGKLIRISDSSSIGILGFAVTPDGRTAYAASQEPGNARQVSVGGVNGIRRCVGSPGVVTPIATATGTPGKPINVGCMPTAIAVTPDGKTVYAASYSGDVTPIATATDQPGKPIKISKSSMLVIGP